MKNSIVIIPTYNEVENIEAIIRNVFELYDDVHILVVDDNSPDLTAVKVADLQEAFESRLFLALREGKSGLGTAYIHGFKWALSRHYSHIFEMDADFSHNPKDLKSLYLACVNGANIAIGSRYVKGVNVVNWPLGRILLSYGASIYVKIVTGMRINDPTAGFMCYTKEALSSIDLNDVNCVGYAFQIEMKYKAYLNKLTLVEVPIIFTDRVKGQSKMSSNIISEAILGVLKLRLQSIFSKRSIK